MYATRRNYVKNLEFSPPETKHRVTVQKNGMPVPYINPEHITVVEEELMSWRKASELHQWFVDNVQDGKDDGGTYSVSKQQLQALLEFCEAKLASAKVKPKDREAPMSTVGNEGNAAATTLPIPTDATTANRSDRRPSSLSFDAQGTVEYHLLDFVDTRDWLARLFEEAAMYPQVLSDIAYSSNW